MGQLLCCRICRRPYQIAVLGGDSKNKHALFERLTKCTEQKSYAHKFLYLYGENLRLVWVEGNEFRDTIWPMFIKPSKGLILTHSAGDNLFDDLEVISKDFLKGDKNYLLVLNYTGREVGMGEYEEKYSEYIKMLRVFEENKTIMEDEGLIWLIDKLRQ